MDRNLKRRVAEAIVAEWKDPKRTTWNVRSENVYKRLVDSGVEVPEGAMTKILYEWKKGGHIVGLQENNRDHPIHGAFVIQSVDPKWLEEF